MAAPNITIVNDLDTTIASWDCGQLLMSMVVALQM